MHVNSTLEIDYTSKWTKWDLIKLLIFKTLPMILYSVFLYFAKVKWYIANPNLSIWLSISLYVYLYVSIYSHIELVIDLITCSHYVSLQIIEVIFSWISALCFALFPLVIIFGIGWDFYGLFLYFNEPYIQEWVFRLTCIII